MVPLIALCRRHKGDGVDFDIDVPTHEPLRSLFHNSNWSHLLDPNRHEPTTFAGAQHFPAQAYRGPEEQGRVVNQILEVVLGSLKLERRQLKTLEWCISEITDNVLNHAESRFGGVVQASSFQQKNSVEFVVADAGVGIARSLVVKDHATALERCIEEGVTRDPKTNQGNGLYGTFRVATLSGGKFEIHSGRASLQGKGSDRLHMTDHQPRLFAGTAVICEISCNDERLIEEALRFKGQTYEPALDYLESRYESPHADIFKFEVRSQQEGFGSRNSGRVVRTKLANLLRAEPNNTLEIDFSGVPLVTSSFADEAIAKLYVEMGPLAFMSRVRLTNIDSTVRALIDRAIMQRSKFPNWQDGD